MSFSLPSPAWRESGRCDSEGGLSDQKIPEDPRSSPRFLARSACVEQQLQLAQPSGPLHPSVQNRATWGVQNRVTCGRQLASKPSIVYGLEDLRGVVKPSSLRRLLASLPGEHRAARRSEVEDQQTARDIIYPFLSENASLTQIANTMAGGRPGLGVSSSPPIYPVIEQRDHTALLGDSEFLGILVREHWDHGDAIRDYENLQTSLERIIRLIDEELRD